MATLDDLCGSTVLDGGAGARDIADALARGAVAILSHCRPWARPKAANPRTHKVPCPRGVQADEAEEWVAGSSPATTKRGVSQMSPMGTVQL
jgi:hypothetical protein